VETMARVLVIDDEPDVLLLCRVNLEHAGHEVLEALDGPHGIELARTRQPDLIVLDLMLPYMDGYEILEKLGDDDRTKDVPVVVLTAKAQREDRIRSWEAGVAEYVTKPFSPTSLAETLDRVRSMTTQERAELRQRKLRQLGEPVR
jgi:two-component system, OmpR family, phosphate regulon response regulator PhoB